MAAFVALMDRYHQAMMAGVRVIEEQTKHLGSGGGGADLAYPIWYYNYRDRVEEKIQEMRALIAEWRQAVIDSSRKA